MPIKFRCKHCQQLLGISQTKSGENVDCPTCGRSVQVPSLDGSTTSSPKPKWNAKDQSLLKALDSLASMNMESSEDLEVSQSEESQAEKNREPTSPVPIALSQPLELPPLESAVVITEPESPPIVESISDSKSNELGDSEAPQKVDAFEKLAALSHVPQADSLSDSPSQSPPAYSQMPASTPIPLKQGLTIPVVSLIALLAFGLGFYAGTWRESKNSTESHQQTVTPDNPSLPLANEQTAPNDEENIFSAAIKGRITYRTTEGSTRPDDGAVVIFLPAYRKSSVRLPIVGFRPADSAEDRNVALAGIRALGGDLVKVGEDGLYESELSQAGEYHVLVLSRHTKRPEESVIPSTDRSALGEFFDRPQQLLGELAYQFGTLNYRGDETEIWDHAFEAI